MKKTKNFRIEIYESYKLVFNSIIKGKKNRIKQIIFLKKIILDKIIIFDKEKNTIISYFYNYLQY